MMCLYTCPSFAVGAKKECDSLLFTETPIEVPNRPFAPTQPVPSQPSLPPMPAPRRAPNPLPDRPLSPTFDPKDIVPVDLYEQDGEMKSFWTNLPDRVRQIFVQESNNHLALLSEEFQRRYGTTPNLRAIAENVAIVSRALAPVERRHKVAIENYVRLLAEDRFGSSTIRVLETSISNELPSRPKTSADRDQSTSSPTVDKNMMRFYSFRRELYNLLAQAEGWFGMSEFIDKGQTQVASLDKELAKLYSELDLNYRLAIPLMLKSIPDASLLQGDELREQITAGREIVCIDCRPVEDELGNKQIEIGRVTGVAVGKNGWALAHEAFKASFQIATALEATQRAPLNTRERQILDDRTNSNIAEIRQGLYGQVLRDHIQKFVARLIDSSSPRSYFVIVERVFSQLPAQTFQSFILDSLQFDPATMDIDSYRRKYREHLLLDEF